MAGTRGRIRRGAASTGSSPSREESAVRCASSSFANVAALVAFLATVALGSAPAMAAVGGSASAEGWNRETLRTLARPQGVRVIEGVSGDPKITVDALERAGYHVDVAVLPS